jgi:alpha-tubulin suppressor-like RCC1 family protein
VRPHTERRRLLLGDDKVIPERVAGAMTFTSVTVGAFATCGMARDGFAYCWGGNDNGQLGDGTNTSRAQPVRVLGQ